MTGTCTAIDGCTLRIAGLDETSLPLLNALRSYENAKAGTRKYLGKLFLENGADLFGR